MNRVDGDKLHSHIRERVDELTAMMTDLTNAKSPGIIAYRNQIHGARDELDRLLQCVLYDGLAADDDDLDSVSAA